jgi:hypothetical protein
MCYYDNCVMILVTTLRLAARAGTDCKKKEGKAKRGDKGPL